MLKQRWYCEPWCFLLLRNSLLNKLLVYDKNYKWMDPDKGSRKVMRLDSVLVKTRIISGKVQLNHVSFISVIYLVCFWTLKSWMRYFSIFILSRSKKLSTSSAWCTISHWGLVTHNENSMFCVPVFQSIAIQFLIQVAFRRVDEIFESSVLKAILRPIRTRQKMNFQDIRTLCRRLFGIWNDILSQ